ncbi:MAG: efflux RND transporter periplasmic adaptor subunit [Syntrophomonadaceae bacterium]|nr:efflux RND transporter periplasmic adaptor subunit [Syntrophomonadaceae bacterium]
MERGRRNKLIIAGAAVVLILAVWAFANRGNDLETVKVRVGDITQTVEDVGYVRAKGEAVLYATQAATVARLDCEVGQAVKAGEVVAVLENLELKAQVADIEANLVQAEASSRSAAYRLQLAELALSNARDNLERVKVLYESGAVSLADYEKARLDMESARAAVEEQEAQLESLSARIQGLRETRGHLAARENELVLKSPVDGVILSLPVKIGQVVAPGTTVATIGGGDGLEVRAYILGEDMAHVAVGQKVLISMPGDDRGHLVGEVSQIYPQAEEKHSALGIVQQRVPVIITLEDTGNLKPGYEVDVAIQTVTRNGVLLVPREMVRTTPEGTQTVKLVEGGRIKEVPVKTGITDGTYIEITEGLTAGMELAY